MKKKQQQHLSGGGDPWPHGAPVGGALPCLGSCKRRIPLLPFLRFSLRDYGFCMATLLVFCLGSLFYQLSGGPPRFLLDLRQYLGKEGLRRPRKSWAPGERVISGKHLKLSRPPRSPRLPRWDANEHPSVSTALRAVRSDAGRQAGVSRPDTTYLSPIVIPTRAE